MAVFYFHKSWYTRSMKIHLAADHAGFEMKNFLKGELISTGYQIVDHGANEYNESDDYPDFITPCSQAVALEDGMGIILGGSGQAEAMCANRVKGIRCALFYGGRMAKIAVDVSGRESTNELEIIRLSREHNNANMISLAARFITQEEALEAVKLFLETDFSQDERHLRRLSKF